MSETKQRSKNTPEEVALVARAWAEGKDIEYWSGMSKKWCPKAYPQTAPGFSNDLYRVKPEPRTFELWASPDGKNIIQYVAPGSEHYYIQSGWAKINVKEIV